jgi:hypothetical protein
MSHYYEETFCAVIKRHEHEVMLMRQTLDRQGKELRSLGSALDAQGLKINGLMKVHERTVEQLAAQTELNARQAADIRRLHHGGTEPFAGDVGLAALILAVALFLFVARAVSRWARTNTTAPPPATTEELIATLLGRLQTR